MNIRDLTLWLLGPMQDGETPCQFTMRICVSCLWMVIVVTIGLALVIAGLSL